MKADLGGLFDRRAGLLRELAGVDELLARAFESAVAPAELEDAVLSLQEAAPFMGEPVSTFRRRPDYVRALVSRPTERRLRYSRAALERIKRDRLEASEMFGGLEGRAGVRPSSGRLAAEAGRAGSGAGGR